MLNGVYLVGDICLGAELGHWWRCLNDVCWSVMMRSCDLTERRYIAACYDWLTGLCGSVWKQAAIYRRITWLAHGGAHQPKQSWPGCKQACVWGGRESEWRHSLSTLWANSTVWSSSTVDWLVTPLAYGYPTRQSDRLTTVATLLHIYRYLISRPTSPTSQFSAELLINEITTSDRWSSAVNKSLNGQHLSIWCL